MKSPGVSMSSEPLLSAHQQSLDSMESQNSVSETPQPKLPEISKRLRSRANQPICDKSLIMKKPKQKSVSKPSFKKLIADCTKKDLRSQSGQLLCDEKLIKKNSKGGTVIKASGRLSRSARHSSSGRQVERSPTNTTLCTASSNKASGALPEKPPSTSSSRDHKTSPTLAPSVDNPLALENPAAPPIAPKIQQPTESQGQIGSTSKPTSEDLSLDIEEITTRPEVYVIDEKVEADVVIVQEKELLHFGGGCIVGVYQFKIFLRDENAPQDEVQIRRFRIKFNGKFIYTHLCKMLQAVFPILKNKFFTLRWRDSDGDLIPVSTSIELEEALIVMKKDQEIMRFCITVRN